MSQINNEDLYDAFKILLRPHAQTFLGFDTFMDGLSVNLYSEKVARLLEEYDPFQERKSVGVSLEIDMNHIRQIPRFGDHIITKIFQTPKETLKSLGECFKEVVFSIHGLDVEDLIPDYHIRVHNISDTYHSKIRNLGSYYTERLVHVTGMVTRISEIKPVLKEGTYQCPMCNETFEIIQEKPGQYTSPVSKWKICPNPECNNRQIKDFTLIERASKLIDWQISYLQEPVEDLPAGTTPKGIDIIFTDDYVEKISPGVRVDITGILYFRPAFNPGKSEAGKDPIFNKFIDVVYIKTISAEEISEDISADDINEILRLKEGRTDLEFESLVVNSIATSMYGYKEIKHGIALLMVGGVEHSIQGEGRKERGDLNILLAGDPSTGKSVNGSEKIYIKTNEVWGQQPIGDFIDRIMANNHDKVKKMNRSEILKIEAKDELFTLGMDPVDLKVKKSKLTEVSRHETESLIKLTTSSGRTIMTTPEHSFTTLEGEELKVMSHKDLTVGSLLPVAKKITLENGTLHYKSKIFWEEISKIEPFNSKTKVYDLGTEHGHFVIAESNIITHNSQLLYYVKDLSPRNAYVSGKKSTAAGITAGIVKDRRNDVMTLEAGAVVFASGGVCLIDEFDKVRGEDLDSLLEVMVSQKVSINKAGIQAVLPAKCSILAAMNPKFLRYRHDLNFSENMNLEETISSRFDLIFLLTDDPQEDFDNKYSDWVLDMWDDPEDNDHRISENSEQEEQETIERRLLMKYIRYAKDFIAPTMTREAKLRTKEYWLELRRASYGGNAMTADRRTLNTIRRLGEANARLCLRDEVTSHDIEVAFNLYQYSLRQIGMDNLSGEADLDAVRGMSHSKQNISVKVIKIIKELIEEADTTDDYTARGGVPFSIIFERVLEKRILIPQEGKDTEGQLESILNGLYENGSILRPKDGTSSSEATFKPTPIRRNIKRG